MTPGGSSHAELVCPLCSGSLETWSRGTLEVEFCDECAALFLDRGELFEMFRAEGYQCPPEAFLRSGFQARPGEVLPCPKCERRSLVPGSLEGCEVWHCTPCNGFLVDRSLLLGIELDEAPLELRGFARTGTAVGPDDEEVSGYVSQILQRIAFWSPSQEQELE